MTLCTVYIYTKISTMYLETISFVIFCMLAFFARILLIYKKIKIVKPDLSVETICLRIVKKYVYLSLFVNMYNFKVSDVSQGNEHSVKTIT